MKKSFTLLDICLALFDGGAAGGAGAAAPAAATNEGGDGAQAGSQAVPGSSRRGKTGGLTNVAYGKQPEAARTEDTTPGAGGDPDAGGQSKEEHAPTKEERLAKFRELVSGEFKDLYTEDTQRIVDRRFRETRSLEEALEAHKPILDMLAQRYKIADGDTAKIARAIEQDNDYWAAAADEAGMGVDQYKQFQKLQRENETFRQAQRQQQSQEAARKQYDGWMQEAEQTGVTYPDFDMAAECKNPQFMAMLKSGVPVQHAYEVAHLDDIKGGIVRQTTQQTEKKVVDGIRAKGARPEENGVSAKSGITFKSDPSKLTRADRAEIAKRASKGENISF